MIVAEMDKIDDDEILDDFKQKVLNMLFDAKREYRNKFRKTSEN